MKSIRFRLLAAAVGGFAGQRYRQIANRGYTPPPPMHGPGLAWMAT